MLDYMESLSVQANPSEYTWYMYKGQKKKKFEGLHRRHTLFLSPGEIFGIKGKRSGNILITKPDSLHIKFRIASDKFKNILDNSKLLKGIPKEATVKEKVERIRSHKTLSDPKRIDYFKINKVVKSERTTLDRANYQWRKFTADATFPLKTEKRTTVRLVLHPGNVFGLRFENKARGGLFVFEDDDGSIVRLRVDTTTYTNLVRASEVIKKQKTGIINTQEAQEKRRQKDATSLKPKKVKQSEEEPKKVRERRKIGSGRPIADPSLQEDDEDLGGFDDLDEPVTPVSAKINPKHLDQKQLETELRQKKLNLQKEKLDKEEQELEKRQEEITKKKEKEFAKVKKEVKKETARPKQNKNDFKIGSVIKFDKDREKKREFLIVDIEPDDDDPSLTRYVVYDVTNKPEFTQVVVLSDTNEKHSITNFAQFMRKSTATDVKLLRKARTLEESVKSVYS